MKMNYLRDNGHGFRRDGSPGWKRPAFLAALVLFIYLWGSSLFSDALTFIAYPFMSLSGRAQSGFASALKTQKSLVEENDRLKKENEDLKVETAKVSSLEQEIIELRGIKEGLGGSWNPVAVRVLVRPGHLPYDEIILDSGSQQFSWLHPGQLVFAHEGVVIGQVESVASRYAKVKLYSTGGVKIPVAVGKAGEPSIAEGQGAGNFALTLPRGLEVEVGDPVKTTIVGDYILGYVGQTVKDPNNPFQRVLFRSPYNIFELKWIFLTQ